MFKTYCSICLTFLSLFALTAVGHAGPASGELSCAQHEIRIAMMLEAYGAPPNPASIAVDEQLAELIQARLGCSSGRYMVALPIYERIVVSLEKLSSVTEVSKR
jgi:hypothetical protein